MDSAQILNQLLQQPDAPEDEDPDFVPHSDSESDDSVQSDNDQLTAKQQLAAETKAAAIYNNLKSESNFGLQRRPTAIYPTFLKLPKFATAPVDTTENSISRLGDGTLTDIKRCQSLGRASEAVLEVDEDLAKQVMIEVKEAHNVVLSTKRIRYAGREFIVQVDAQGKAKTTPASDFDRLAAGVEAALQEGKQISTLEKSNIDWQQNLKGTEEQRLLEARRKGDSGFLGRKRFIERVQDAEHGSIKRKRRR